MSTSIAEHDVVQPETLSIEEYAELLNGRMAGMRLAFNLFVAYSSSEQALEEYIDNLKDVQSKIKSGLENNEFEFVSDGYPNGTLIALDEMIDALSNMKDVKQEYELK